MKKNIFISLIVSALFMFVLGLNVYAEGGTAEETKTWSDQILDYVPVVVEGIVAFAGTIFALILSTKKVTISMNDLTKAKNNFSSVTKEVKDLAKKLEDCNEYFEGNTKVIKKLVENQKKIMEILKTMAVNDKQSVANGTAMQVVDILEGADDNGEQEETVSQTETNN